MAASKRFHRSAREDLVNAVDKKLTGRIAPDRIRMMTVRARRKAWSSASWRSAIRAASCPTPWTSSASARRHRRLGAAADRCRHHDRRGRRSPCATSLQRTNPLDGARTTPTRCRVRGA